MRRRRNLDPEEQALWQAVARTTRPLHAETISIPAAYLSAAAEPPHAKNLPEAARTIPAIPAFHMGEKATNLSGTTSSLFRWEDDSIKPALQMDARTHGRMIRGKLAPEARIDLHGMTLAEAHGALVRFILAAHADGLRLVLIITGKGKRSEDHGPIPQRIGALRHQVPIWLRLPPLGPAVLQVAEAHLKHGAGGACYVYLRRR